MRRSKLYGRYYGIDDTVESLYHRALKGDASPEDHTWELVMFYRGVIDRKEGKRRVLSDTEAKHRPSYDRGWEEMGKLVAKESYEAKTR